MLIERDFIDEIALYFSRHGGATLGTVIFYKNIWVSDECA